MITLRAAMILLCGVRSGVSLHLSMIFFQVFDIRRKALLGSNIPATENLA